MNEATQAVTDEIVSEILCSIRIGSEQYAAKAWLLATGGAPRR